MATTVDPIGSVTVVMMPCLMVSQGFRNRRSVDAASTTKQSNSTIEPWPACAHVKVRRAALRMMRRGVMKAGKGHSPFSRFLRSYGRSDTPPLQAQILISPVRATDLRLSQSEGLRRSSGLRVIQIPSKLSFFLAVFHVVMMFSERVCTSAGLKLMHCRGPIGVSGHPGRSWPRLPAT